MPALARYPKSSHEQVLLHTATAITATETGSSGRMPNAVAYAFTLDVTSAATAAGDTLDVEIQTMLDGSNWTKVVAFTQVLGNGSAKRHIAKIESGEVEAMFEAAAALAAGSVRNLAGDEWRVVATVVNGDTPIFTFTVHGIPVG